MREHYETDYACGFRIRPFLVSDLDCALCVEADSFSFPWTRGMFQSEIEREDISRCFVAEAMPCGDAVPGKEAVAGYVMSWLVADELHITNLAVSPAYRRLGLAARLIEHLLGESKADGASWCQLEVRITNIPARALYRKFRFREIGVRKGYYQDGEDAVVMGKDLRT